MHTLCLSLLRDRSSHAIATLLSLGLFFLFTNSVGAISSFTSRLSPNPSNLCSRSMTTWCWQTIFRLKLNFFYRMTRTYIVEPFHRQLALRIEFIGIWKNIFPFTDTSPALFFCCLTFKHFIIIRLIKRTQIMSLC